MRAMTAMSILNDVLPSANPNGQNQDVWRGRDRFGIESPDVKFIPYWTKDTGVTTSPDENLYTAAWQKPGSVLIAIINKGESTTATIRIDPNKLNLSPDYKTLDADTGIPIPMSSTNTITVSINRHDYRQLLLAP